MKTIRYFGFSITTLLILGLLVSCNNNIYQVGTSVVSIEPTDETVSLTLAGYAAPPLGRFSLIWEDKGLIADIAEFEEIKNILLHKKEKPNTENIISKTQDNKRYYAVTSDNILLQRDINTTKDWQRIGYDNKETYNIDIKRIVSHKGKLYTLASDGHVYASHHNTEGNLSARAVAIEKKGKTAVIVGVDVCGFDYSFTSSIKKEIFRKRGIPEDAIMINASHTHFAPVTQKWQTWGTHHQYPDSLYLNNVVYKGVIKAIEDALDQMKPSHISFTRDTTNIGYNRNLKGDLAIYDNTVDVLKIVSVDNKQESLIFLTGCHPVLADHTTGKYTISANFPGYTRNQLESEGYNYSLFLQACGGDINPKHPSKTTGNILANDVLRSLRKEMSAVKGNIHTTIDSIGIPVTPCTKEEILAFRNENIDKVENIKGGYKSDIAGRNVRWADMMIKHYEGNTLPETMNIYLQTFDIGDWKLIGISREVTTEYGLAIKDIWPKQKVSVIGYTNDVSSYLATDPHIRAKDYEGYESFIWYGQPSIFPLGTFDTIVDYLQSRK